MAYLYFDGKGFVNERRFSYNRRGNISTRKQTRGLPPAGPPETKNGPPVPEPGPASRYDFTDRR
ncbi:hypothetical protein GCM10027018_18130 [Paenibacillus thermoaerophilus]